MKQRVDIGKKIDETLNSFDGIRRATPQPYFYTRLIARLAKKENSWSGIAGLIGRPVYAFTMICVVLFVNTWIVFNNDTDVIPGNSQQAVTADLPDEYNLAVTTFYDYETP